MYVRLISVSLLLVLATPGGYAQKRSKKRPAHSRYTEINTPPQAQPATPVVDISNPPPGSVPVPQENTLTPEMKKTKKVIIVPAPPPPPGRDPVPPYPKR